MGRRSSQPYYPSNQDNDIPPEQAGIMASYDTEENMKQGEAPYVIEQMVEALHKADQDIAERIARRHDLFDRLQEQTRGLNRVVQERADWFEGNVRGNPVPERAGMDISPGPTTGRY